MSPTATAAAPEPPGATRKLLVGVKPPLPLPTRTLTLLLPELAMTISGRPSLVTSATAKVNALVPPVLTGEPGAGENAGAVVQQHADVIAAEVGDEEVGLAVAVDVRHLDAMRVVPPELKGEPESVKPPLPLPSSTYVVAALVGGNDIDLAVAVDIGRRQGVRSHTPRGNRSSRQGEATSAVAEQHIDVVAAVVSGDDVQFAVVVDVYQCRAQGVCPAGSDCARPRSVKPPLPLPSMTLMGCWN